MTARFLDVLHVEPIRKRIFMHQHGVYEDVRYRFLEFRWKVQVSKEHFAGRGHDCRLGGRIVSSPFHKKPVGTVTDRNLCLNEMVHRDARFPLHLAIYEGNLHDTQRIMACRPDLVYKEAIACAFACGKIHIVQYLLHQRPSVPQLDWSTETQTSGTFKSRNLPQYVVYFGSIELLELLRSYSPASWNDEVMRSAIRWRHTHCIRYLWKTCPSTVYADMFCDVAFAGLSSMALRCYRAGMPLDANVMKGAASGGHLGIVRFIHERWSGGSANQAVQAAYIHGHIHIVRFLVTHRTEFAGTRGVDAASAYGLLDVVVDFIHRGYIGSEDAANRALRNGHISVVEYLVSAGYKLDLRGLTPLAVWCWNEPKVARSSTMEMLRFLHGREFRFSDQWVDFAAAEGHIEAVRYLVAAARAGCSSKALDAAVFHPEVLEFLVTHTTTHCTPKAFVNALHWKTPIGVFALLLRHFRGQCTMDVLQYARIEQRADVVALLRQDNMFGRSFIRK
ncbi:hypothetical protein ACHHYP_02170 [Achlya hypogyna]|uniref:Ankyrin repeat protein n=1 Tax=Achlya hypogyna TaxID=1202772 RepID=A0A1V9ZSF0_ACHHY|nr:hypothetical protein ACHHYP_02170 [Achlya hypogyna]